MSSREFTEWIAFNKIEPFGSWRDDVRVGVLGASLAPLLATFKGKPPTIEDFMPRFTDEPTEPRREDPDAMWRKLAAVTTAMGGQVIG